ncbi:hypothetical protein ACFVYV_43420 [Streptomyces mirabilis]|uniref:hypothetical protein n=1 Tax=Streptomyces mirabilis TaxID=68239 RepID=UPI0036D7B5F7
MTDRYTADTINSDALDDLYDRLEAAEAALAGVIANATEWQKLAPADGWGNTPQDTVMADAGRFLLKLVELTAKNNPYVWQTAAIASVREWAGGLDELARQVAGPDAVHPVAAHIRHLLDQPKDGRPC